jgi:hypothetical protein
MECLRTSRPSRGWWLSRSCCWASKTRRASRRALCAPRANPSRCRRRAHTPVTLSTWKSSSGPLSAQSFPRLLHCLHCRGSEGDLCQAPPCPTRIWLTCSQRLWDAPYTGRPYSKVQSRPNNYAPESDKSPNPTPNSMTFTELRPDPPASGCLNIGPFGCEGVQIIPPF